MTLFKLHLRPGIRPYLFFITIQLACAASLIYARQFYQHQANTVNTLQQRLSSLKIQETTWSQQQILLNEYLPQYQHLLQSGLISEDYNKQSTINTSLRLQQLKSIQQTHALFPINYSISNAPTHQMPFENAQATVGAMHIEMNLLHEDDLLTLLSNLKNSRHGRFLARSCKLSRLSANDDDMQQLKPHLQATCELGWFSISSLAGLHKTP